MNLRGNDTIQSMEGVFVKVHLHNKFTQQFASLIYNFYTFRRTVLVLCLYSCPRPHKYEGQASNKE